MVVLSISHPPSIRPSNDLQFQVDLPPYFTIFPHPQIFINNEWQKSKSGKSFPSINPTTEKEIAQVQQGDKTDIDIAVAAAKNAFK